MLLGGDQDKSKVMDASEEAMLEAGKEEEKEQASSQEQEQAAKKKVILSKGGKPAGEGGKAGEEYAEEW